MPSTFDALFTAAGVPLLMDQLGIPAHYTPREGAARAITVVAAYQEQETIADQLVEREQELLWVTARRSATTGISAPQSGDRLLRDDEDDAEAPWSFQGQVRNASLGCWELLFARIRPRRYGPH